MHAQSSPTLVTPRTIARQAPLSMGFSQKEYWSGLPFPLPGDLADPGMELASPEVPALTGGSLPLSYVGSLKHTVATFY